MKLNSGKNEVIVKKTYFFINIFYYLFLFCNILYIIFLLSFILGRAFNIEHVSIFVPNTHFTTVPINNIIYNIHSLEGTMTVSNVPIFISVLFNLPKLILAFGVLYIAIALKKILNSILDRNVFQKANETRIKSIGLIVIILPIVMQIKDYFKMRYLPENLISQGLGITETFNFFKSFSWSIPFNLTFLLLNGNITSFAYIALGIVIIFLGYVFKEGNRLKEENNLTV